MFSWLDNIHRKHVIRAGAAALAVLLVFLFVGALWETISLRLDRSSDTPNGPSKHAGRCPDGQVTYVEASGSICLPAEGAGRLRGYQQGVNDTLRLVHKGKIPCETTRRVGP